MTARSCARLAMLGSKKITPAASPARIRGSATAEESARCRHRRCADRQAAGATAAVGASAWRLSRGAGVRRNADVSWPPRYRRAGQSADASRSSRYRGAGRSAPQRGRSSAGPASRARTDRRECGRDRRSKPTIPSAVAAAPTTSRPASANRRDLSLSTIRDSGWRVRYATRHHHR